MPTSSPDSSSETLSNRSPDALSDVLPETATVSLDTVKASLKDTEHDANASGETDTETSSDSAPASRSGRPRNLKEAAEFVRQSERPSVIAFPWQAWLSLGILFTVFVAIGATYFWVVYQEVSYSWLAPAMTVLWLVAGSGVLALFYWMWSEFTRFGDELSDWAMRLRRNDLSARMAIRGSSCPSHRIRERINAITEDYQALSRSQQMRLNRQERSIEQKQHHLSVLFDVATCINRADNLEDLLYRFLNTLKEVVDARAATVRLLDDNDQMRLVASIGLDTNVVSLEETLPSSDCLCGRAIHAGGVQVRSNLKQCGLLVGQPFFKDESEVELLVIPLQYRDKMLGVYNLFIAKDQFEDLEEEHGLLISIGQHLGMAIEKSSVDEEARTLSIMEERTRMAHELHDSLAQTLASLRFKVRLFDDSLNRGEESVIWQELEGLENTIDEAYAELRSLITHFRAPIDGKGVVRAVESVVERFRKETDLEVFFYHNWHLDDLDRDIEIEVIRIVQESLANVRKHSKAETVRILMYASEEGRCSILVEDDGQGLPDPLPEPNEVTGEHIGIHVMSERAERIGGEIQFESDPDEGGTLVQLNFDVAAPERKFSELVGQRPVTPLR